MAKKDSPADATPPHIARMDAAASRLLDIVEADKTSEAQRGRLFAQVLNYYKVRDSLMPVTAGNKLKEMSDGLKSQGGQRNGSPGTPTESAPGDASAAGGTTPAESGAAIKALIARLPSFADAAGRDPKNPKRANGSVPRDDRGVPADRRSDGAGNMDVAGDLHLVRPADFRPDCADRLQSA